MIEGYTEDRAEFLSQWGELDAIVDELEQPILYAPGSHDYSNQVMTDLWEERLGDSYYSHYNFEYKDALSIILNSSLFNTIDVNADNEIIRGWSQKQCDQLTWLRQTLADHSDVR